MATPENFTRHTLCRGRNLARKALRKWSLTTRQRQAVYAALKESQDEIESSIPLFYSKYRPEEFDYWSHIPFWLHEQHKKRPIRSCLDIGCAYGTLALFTRKLFACSVFCTDFHPGYFSTEIFKEYDIAFRQSNIELEEIPWTEDFDAIIFTETIEHLNFHPLTTLKKISESLSPEGRLYLSTPDASEHGVWTKYYNSLQEVPDTKERKKTLVDDHVWQYNRRELEQVCAEAGLVIEKLAHSPGTLHRHFNLCLKRQRGS